MVAASDHKFLLMDNTTYMHNAATGYSVDVTYTSRLKRAIRSAWVLLMCLNEVYKPVYKVGRLVTDCSYSMT
jgi:bisphosphoglycerate-dependent phosphoglycerate mutase